MTILRRKTSLFLVTFAVLGFAFGCGKKHVNLNPASSVPAATASAVLTHDSNGNTIVDLKVKHLAKPENLTPPKSVYVVWIQPRGGAPIKQGQLEVNNNLEGEFKSPTTYKTFDIFVTAEDSGDVTQPTGQEVLRQAVTG
ncbi:MAG: anti-sigma factor [Candidatus Sulfotelmatobacter sp.]